MPSRKIIIKMFLILFLILNIQKVFSQEYEVSVLNLSELLKMVMENPEVRELKQKLEAQKAKAKYVQTLPDLMIEFGYSKKEIGMKEKSLMFEQAFPYRGKLAIRGEIEKKEVEIIEQKLRTKILELKRETKMDFYDLFLTKKELEILNRTKNYLEMMINISSVMYSTGMIPQSDILKAQTELLMLKEREIMLSRENERLINRIERCCLGLPLEVKIKIDVPDKLEIEKLDKEYNKLQEIALERSPMLKMRRLEREKMNLEVTMAELEFKPDFITSAEFMNPDKNFKNWNIKFGIMYPLYKNKKQKFEKIEAERNFHANEMLYENERQMLSYNLNKAYLMAKGSEEVIKLYKGGVIPQLSLTLESAIANYKAGKIDFMTVLENIRELQDIELSYLREVVKHKKAVAEIEEFLGWDVE